MGRAVLGAGCLMSDFGFVLAVLAVAVVFFAVGTGVFGLNPLACCCTVDADAGLVTRGLTGDGEWGLGATLVGCGAGDLGVETGATLPGFGGVRGGDDDEVFVPFLMGS